MSKLNTLLAGVAAVALSTAFVPAYADIPTSGTSPGTVMGDPGNEVMFFGNGGWGSPGISHTITLYGNPTKAFGLDLTFTGGGVITPGSIAVGNAAGCAGDITGGTTFCTISPTDIWEAFQTGPESVDFLAQNATFDVTSGGPDYFVNVLFTDGAPTSFTGKWLTEFSPSPVPEPGSLAVLASGLAAFGLMRRRRRGAATS